MPEMTGGEAVVETLKAAGVTHVFGIPSVHNLPIYDAILRDGSITPIGVRHEQGAVHAADGYARATGRLGVALTSTGPGASNGMTGMFEAGFASAPVLMITGQIESLYYGRGKGFLHEAERQLPMLRSVTRLAESVRGTEEIPETLMRVISDIQTGRPQPGAVEIPIDFQYARGAVDIPAVENWPRVRPPQEPVSEAARMLTEAERPLIWAGGGVHRAGAHQELLQLAERLGVPVVTTVNGRGALPEDHPLAVGAMLQSPPVRELTQRADVVLAVGTRFQGNATGNWSLPIPGKLIHLDADPGVIHRNYRADVAIVGDARLGLAALLRNVAGDRDDHDGWVEEARAAAEAARAAMRDQIGPDHLEIATIIRELLPRDGIVVRDATVPAYTWGNQLLPILEPRTSIHPTSAAIGPALPLGIGAAVGTGRKTVVIAGDGGFMLNVAELATAVEANAPLVVCIFNDGGYGVLRGIQSNNFEGRRVGVDLVTPDFAAVARGMRMHAASVSGVEAFREAFDEGIRHDGPMLLDIDMDSLAPITRIGGRAQERQQPSREPAGTRGG